MAALRAGDDAVRAHHHVAVEVNVHLQRSKDYVVQPVHKRTFVEGIGIRACGNPVVRRIDHIADRVQVKSLGIHQHADHTPIQQIAHGLG